MISTNGRFRARRGVPAPDRVQPLASEQPAGAGSLRFGSLSGSDMSTVDRHLDDEPRLTPGQVEDVIAEQCFPRDDEWTAPGKVGLEVERFPIHPTAGRLTIEEGDICTRAVLGDRFGEQQEIRGLPAYPVASGGHLTFEPGGQLEHVTRPHETAAGAMAASEAVSADLAETFALSSAVLASSGIDLWHDPETVEQQLPAFRYPAMDAYFRARGHAGPLMMRHSCSLQISLDLGRPADRRERWLVGNLISPLLTATFANSPTRGRASARAAAWQALDPTRTGFPLTLVDGSTDDPIAHITRAAVDADVLLVRTGPGRAEPGRPGWTFGAWIRDGHPEFGFPTATDLGYHLSTLFLELRPRGKVEFRSIDAIPQPWRCVPIVLLVGAIEDPTARSTLLDLLSPYRSRLPQLWVDAAARGVAPPSMCALAVEAWSFALEGAMRLPESYLTREMLVRTEEFLDRFTLRGRCPADEIGELFAESPERALAWAAEPVPRYAASGR